MRYPVTDRKPDCNNLWTARTKNWAIFFSNRHSQKWKCCLGRIASTCFSSTITMGWNPFSRSIPISIHLLFHKILYQFSLNHCLCLFGYGVSSKVARLFDFKERPKMGTISKKFICKWKRFLRLKIDFVFRCCHFLRSWNNAYLQMQ